MTETFDAKEYLQQGNWRDMKLGLRRMGVLLRNLGNPEQKMKFVHVAGTNGKGSTCAFISSILQEAGYKTGLFTSPYVFEFNERIQINGSNIPDSDLERLALQVKDKADFMPDPPSAFELITAVALLYFLEQDCDIAVLEVGLGGRLDSTNVVIPEVSVITPISLDHTHVLGDTIAKIAAEKAGILKTDVPLVCNIPDYAAARVVLGRAAGMGISTTTVNLMNVNSRMAEGVRTFGYDEFQNVPLKMMGSYQPQNAALAVEAAKALRLRGWKITDRDIYQGIAHATWPGRFQVVSRDPLIIVDGGHNAQGAQVLAQSLKDVVGTGKVTFVMSVMADKDYPAMISAVGGLASSFHLSCLPENERALPASDLAQAVVDQGISAQAYPTLDQAVAGALEAMAVEGSSALCCFGSLYAIGQIRDALEKAGCLSE
ncbi:MAG: bifunctional folylpolyglutamate synthase/dihydrofolate synthase [Eggerthellales bacterium]|nr:bifunctional folylpolyglutamate synthase/dihydrofolate synthase [Eggerthellales bacterium]